MTGNVHGRLQRLESQLNTETNPHPMSLPISEEDMAFISALEDTTDNTTPEERRRAWPEILRLAAEKGLRPLGYTDSEIDEYADAYIRSTEEERARQDEKRGWGGGNT